MQSILVIRAESELKLDMAINSISKQGSIVFENNPKMIRSDYADQILVSVMKTDLKSPCKVAAMIALKNPPSDAINKLKKTNPPAHLIVVSPRYNIYQTLVKKIDSLLDIK
ncbi:DUF356 domain-containing protein [Candidatus Dependentiae bacterium]|nr:DUF356 domain-containing protein [Candidatus Dependentiae bacterium]